MPNLFYDDENELGNFEQRNLLIHFSAPFLPLLFQD